MTGVVIRPGNVVDVAKLYGSVKRPSLDVWAVDWNGELAGVAAVMRGGVPTIVMAMVEGASFPAKLVLRTSREVMKQVLARYPEVYALCDLSKPGSAKFLHKLGFRYTRRELGAEVHVCRACW